MAGILAAAVCTTAVVLFYRASGRQYAERQRQLRENYREIYRIIALPAELSKVQKAEGAQIRIGDYGWEAEPLQEDGLIYLQGLTPEWRVVWHAGFASDQIEKVSSKPQSQYDWKYSWMSNPPPCPFPVQPRETPDMDLPVVKARALSN